VMPNTLPRLDILDRMVNHGSNFDFMFSKFSVIKLMNFQVRNSLTKRIKRQVWLFSIIGLLIALYND
jgi:hypothetical protein